MNKEELELKILQLQKQLYYGALFGDKALVERCKKELEEVKKNTKNK